MDPAAATRARRRSAGRPPVAPRNQVRRLPDARGPRSRRCALLTRTGLDWTHKHPAIAAAMASLGARQAYLDGELCGDGITSFSMIQLASDAGIAAGLMFFLFDLLYLDGVDVSAQPLQERNAARRFAGECEFTPAIQRSPGGARSRLLREGLCAVGRGHCFEARRCSLHARQPWPVAQGQCLHREEFVVVGWTA